MFLLALEALDRGWRAAAGPRPGAPGAPPAGSANCTTDPDILARIDVFVRLASREPVGTARARRVVEWALSADERVELSDSGVPRARARCPVCGEATSREALCDCESCGALHHVDCWEYVGACARYGCGGSVARIRWEAGAPSPAPHAGG